MSSQSPSFQLKTKNGESRLIWRNPFADHRAATHLGPVLQALAEPEPGSITLGRFKFFGGEFGFVPAPSPLARAALTFGPVSQRISSELAALLQQSQPEQTPAPAVKEPSSRKNISITDSRAAIAKRLGGGNVSKGIGLALDRCGDSPPALPE